MSFGREAKLGESSMFSSLICFSEEATSTELLSVCSPPCVLPNLSIGRCILANYWSGEVYPSCLDFFPIRFFTREFFGSAAGMTLNLFDVSIKIFPEFSLLCAANLRFGSEGEVILCAVRPTDGVIATLRPCDKLAMLSELMPVILLAISHCAGIIPPVY